MSLPPQGQRRGVTLRHWTADSISFVGGRERPSLALVDQEVADGRRLNLIASKLKLIRVLRAGPTRTVAVPES
jgi:hypothetical protein